MTTYSVLQQRIFRGLGDPDGKQHTEDEVYDGVVGAHEAILPWVPKFCVASYTSGSSPAAYSLPADCYQVETVQEVDSGLFIPRATLAPKTTRNVATYADNDWIEYPSGVLSLSKDVPVGSQIRVYYRGLWSLPRNATDANYVLEPPRHALTGMVYYACAYVLLPPAVKAGNLRQYGTRQDSGTPEDNPLEVLADIFLRRFYQEMKMMPPYTKVSAA